MAEPLCAQGHYSEIECKAYNAGIEQAIKHIKKDCEHGKFSERCLHEHLVAGLWAIITRSGQCLEEEN